MAWVDSKSIVTLAYKYALGTSELSGIDYTKLKVYTTDSNFYSANYNRFLGITGENYIEDESIKDYKILKLGDLTKPYTIITTAENGETGEIIKNTTVVSGTYRPTNIRLGDIIIDSINNETNLRSDSKQTYENAKNSACSSIIFNNSKCGSWVTQDLDYEGFDNNGIVQNEAYFKNEYNFSTNYSSAEYRNYDVKEELLLENVIRLSAINFEMLDNKVSANYNSMSAGAGGLLLTYEGTSKYQNDNELPVVFFNFGKTLYSNKNYLKVDWNNTGIINVI